MKRGKDSAEETPAESSSANMSMTPLATRLSQESTRKLSSLSPTISLTPKILAEKGESIQIFAPALFVYSKGKFPPNEDGITDDMKDFLDGTIERLLEARKETTLNNQESKLDSEGNPGTAEPVDNEKANAEKIDEGTEQHASFDLATFNAEIYSPSVMNKLFDICQSKKGPKSQEEEEEGKEEQLELPEFLKPDFTIILTTPVTTDGSETPGKLKGHQRQASRSVVVPSAPIRRPVEAPPRLPQQQLNHARLSAFTMPTTTNSASSAPKPPTVPQRQPSHARVPSVTVSNATSAETSATAQRKPTHARVPSFARPTANSARQAGDTSSAQSTRSTPSHSQTPSLSAPTARQSNHGRNLSIGQPATGSHSRSVSLAVPAEESRNLGKQVATQLHQRKQAKHARATSTSLTSKSTSSHTRSRSVAVSSNTENQAAGPPSKPFLTRHSRTLSQQPEKPKEKEIATFHVHRSILALTSSYYESLFSGPWADSETTTSTLSTEYVGTAFGLEQTLRLCYTGTSLNLPILVPSTGPKGEQLPLKPMPLFHNYEISTFLSRGEGESNPYNFLSNLRTGLQIDTYISHSLSILPSSSYLLLNIDVPHLLNTKITTNLVRLFNSLPLAYQSSIGLSPPSDLISRLPPLLFPHPSLTPALTTTLSHLITTAPFHWKKPLLTYPPSLFTLFLNTLESHLNIPPEPPFEDLEPFTFFHKLHTFRRQIRPHSRNFPQWETVIFGPIRSLLASSFITIIAEGGRWDRFPSEDEDEGDEKEGERLLMHPSDMNHIIYDHYNTDNLLKAEPSKELGRALADVKLWALLARLRGSSFEDDDLLDLLQRATTPRGRDVVDVGTGEAVGGEGVLCAGNGDAVERLILACKGGDVFCGRPRERTETLFPGGRRVGLGERIKGRLEEFERRVEGERVKWRAGWVGL